MNKPALSQLHRQKKTDHLVDLSEHKLAEALLTSQQELTAVIGGAKVILGKTKFDEAAREIFNRCCELTGATSGYVALLSEDGQENEVLFLEGGGMECTVDPELPMPIRGLREESYKSNCAVYHNDFMNSDWVEMMPAGHMALKNVMFAPLVIENKAVGIMGLANKKDDFDDRDAELASVFGDLAAIALQNSRFLEERQKAEANLSETVKELKEAIQKIKTLSGIIPICAYCKGIRNDHGYWDRLEKYIEDNSLAEFSHGICPTCFEEQKKKYNLS
jgi:transcriptional regulator with GAF, ATPase, and Fis domain